MGYEEMPELVVTLILSPEMPTNDVPPRSLTPSLAFRPFPFAWLPSNADICANACPGVELISSPDVWTLAALPDLSLYRVSHETSGWFLFAVVSGASVMPSWRREWAALSAPETSSETKMASAEPDERLQ